MAEESDERLLKSGSELFHELLRVYSVAEVDDYFKAGQWKDELMRTDLQLVEKHRREAGAPEPPDLSEVKLPEMPKATVMFQARPPAFGAAASAAVTTPTLGSAVAELRLIALFVAKWKLDTTRTKTVLSKLVPARRRHVIASFKTENSGEEATQALEEFITECNEKNSWPANTVASPVAVAGVKRPLSAVSPSLVFDPNKRLATTSAVGYRPAVRPLTQARPVTIPARAATPSPAAQALAARLAATAATRPRAMLPMRQLSAFARPVAGYRPVAVAAKPAVRPAWGSASVRPVARPVTPIRPVWGARPAVSAYRPPVRPTRLW